MYATSSLLTSLPASLNILKLSDTGDCFDAGDARQPQLRARQAMLWPSLAAGFAISTFAASLIFDNATRQYGATLAGTLAIGMYLFGCSNVVIDCCMPKAAGPAPDPDGPFAGPASASASASASVSSQSETVTLNDRSSPERTSMRSPPVSEDTRASDRVPQAPSLQARLHGRPEKSDGGTLVLASTCVAAGAGTLLGALVERSARMLLGTAAGGVGGALLGVASLAICQLDCAREHDDENARTGGSERDTEHDTERDSAHDSEGQTSELITLSSTDSEDRSDDSIIISGGDSSTVIDDGDVSDDGDLSDDGNVSDDRTPARRTESNQK